MSVAVLDASALLAFALGGDGADCVEALLTDEATYCSSVNWSETAQKIRAGGADWPVAAGLFLSYGLRVEPATVIDAERAAELWRRGSGLSLADRLCLALGERLGAVTWTADAAWGASDGVRHIR